MTDGRMFAMRVAPLMIAAAALAGCGGGHAPNSAMLSPSGGGLAPAREMATPVVSGTLLATDAAKSLEQADQDFMNQQTNRALESAPTNQPVKWQNPASGYQAQVVSTHTYQLPDGSYCRDYTQSIFVKDQAQTARGAACRDSDGTWRAAG